MAVVHKLTLSRSLPALYHSMIVRRLVFTFVACFFLLSCKIDLYSDLQEQEGNEMLALLLEAGIDSEKAPSGDGLVNLRVDEKKIALAVNLLKENGYPRDRFASIGDVFSSDGLISSPLHEKARYIYALSQDISETISQIDGVLVSRVHVVLGEKDRNGREIKAPSASVFIKHTEGLATGSLTPKIKDIVANGIESLDYQHVSVAYFPSSRNSGNRSAQNNLKTVLFLDMSKDSVASFYIFAAALIALLLFSLLANAWLSMRLNKRPDKTPPEGE